MGNDSVAFTLLFAGAVYGIAHSLALGMLWAWDSLKANPDAKDIKSERNKCFGYAGFAAACVLAIMAMNKMSDKKEIKHSKKDKTAYVQKFQNASNYRFNAKSNKFAKLR